MLNTKELKQIITCYFNTWWCPTKRSFNVVLNLEPYCIPRDSFALQKFMKFQSWSKANRIRNLTMQTLGCIWKGNGPSLAISSLLLHFALDTKLMCSRKKNQISFSNIVLHKMKLKWELWWIHEAGSFIKMRMQFKPNLRSFSSANYAIKT